MFIEYVDIGRDDWEVASRIDVSNSTEAHLVDLEPQTTYQARFIEVDEEGNRVRAGRVCYFDTREIDCTPKSNCVVC